MEVALKYQADKNEPDGGKCYIWLYCTDVVWTLGFCNLQCLRQEDEGYLIRCLHDFIKVDTVMD